MSSFLGVKSSIKYTTHAKRQTNTEPKSHLLNEIQHAGLTVNKDFVHHPTTLHTQPIRKSSRIHEHGVRKHSKVEDHHHHQPHHDNSHPHRKTSRIDEKTGAIRKASRSEADNLSMLQKLGQLNFFGNQKPINQHHVDQTSLRQPHHVNAQTIPTNFSTVAAAPRKPSRTHFVAPPRKHSIDPGAAFWG